MSSHGAAQTDGQPVRQWRQLTAPGCGGRCRAGIWAGEWGRGCGHFAWGHLHCFLSVQNGLNNKNARITTTPIPPSPPSWDSSSWASAAKLVFLPNLGPSRPEQVNPNIGYLIFFPLTDLSPLSCFNCSPPPLSQVRSGYRGQRQPPSRREPPSSTTRQSMWHCAHVWSANRFPNQYNITDSRARM